MLMRELAALTARLAKAENTIIALRAGTGRGIDGKLPARGAPDTGSRLERMVRERTRELTILTGELQAEIRERMRTEEKLLAEKAYREAVENCLVVGIVAVDPKGRHFHVNDAFCSMTGFRREDLLGAGIPYPYWHPEERKSYAAAMRKVLKGEIAPGGHEFRFLTRDGRSLDVLLYASPLTVKGKVVGSLSSVNDITDRKRVESALRESEAKFQNLVETVSDLVWEVNRDGFYTYVSPKIRDLLGYTPEEILGKTPFDLMPAFEAQRVAEIFRPISERGEPFQGLEHINRHKDGHYVVIETSGAPVFDAEGVFQGYRGVDRNIDDRKRAEEKLRRSEERFRQLFEQNEEPLFLFRGGSPEILDVNPAAVRLYGYSREELVQKRSLPVRAAGGAFGVLRRHHRHRIRGHGDRTVDPSPEGRHPDHRLHPREGDPDGGRARGLLLLPGHHDAHPAGGGGEASPGAAHPREPDDLPRDDRLRRRA